MPRRGRPKRVWKAYNFYISELQNAEYSPRHITEAKRICKKFIEFTNEKPLEKIHRDEIRAFMFQWEAGVTRRYYRSHIQKFLEILDVYTHKSIIWPKDPVDIRPNVTWLKPWQVHQLEALYKTPEEELIIHLGISLGLRRIDMIRLKVKDIDFKEGWVNFRSKGHLIRAVPFSPETTQIIENYIHFRDSIIESGRGNEPKQIFVGLRHRRYLTNLERTAMDNRLKAIAHRLPFTLEYHELRRTWAREAWEFDVKPEIISYLLGHRDTKQTLKYIGVQGDHAKEGILAVYKGRLKRNHNYSRLTEIRIPGGD